MKIGILTSSRADYGIYLPLLQKIKKDTFFTIEIIAFGTHVSKGHGYTLNEIVKDSYPIIHIISSLISNDDEESISASYGITIMKFSTFWTNNQYDLVFCLGDRFEMSAAVQSGIPFGVKFAHIHGGETTLGAIDNIYRHQISLASILHFTATELFKERVAQLTEQKSGIFCVGALSLDEINIFKPIEKEKFYKTFNIPTEDFALVTFHPETVSVNDNYQYAKEMKKALTKISDKVTVVITMPNADTLGSIYRDELIKLQQNVPNRIILIENFGKKNYFSAMLYSKIMIGNTSSGIIEAASFGKYVINVGDRQKGRIQSENLINCEFDEQAIFYATCKALEQKKFTGKNVYYKDGAADQIIYNLKKLIALSLNNG